MGLAFILVHEMDAVRCREWAIFPLLARLEDKIGYYVFVAAHILLYLLMFVGLYRGNELNLNVVKGLDTFFIVHVFLHILFLKHPKNQFTGLFSWVIIVGSGIVGVLDLVFVY